MVNFLKMQNDTLNDRLNIQIALEGVILDSIKAGQLNNALKTYKKIVNVYILNDIGNGCRLRCIKNHIISLSALINRMIIDIGINSNLLKIKNYKFLNKIESSNSIKDVIAMGEKMIEEYCNVILDNYSCTENILIRKAISYIHNNFSENIKLDDVCNHVHISKTYFCSLFKKYTGMCFSKYLNNIRIEKSKELLKKNEMSILDISIAVGFNNQSYFSKLFKDNTGITPKEFRKNYFNKYIYK
ncbi:AraC family transcriptional regulator [Caloranaerobacter azorensis]|uniref:Helix-turn-helix transcriptional regulator n=1 Tax=Caloranaerobacter azorensis TaxID=116090 RepID=A0A6P1YGD9_9FIRM|nr:AraC family transcriptional regulator [Caloranaerobacter azorensis]QIB27833.1 helix-turn-helix transcriptional regulator [Caloranaerobacter azorensis]